MVGRTKGSKNKPKVGVGVVINNGTAKPGSNGGPAMPVELTDDEKRVLLFQHKNHYDAALAEKKKADAALKNVCKRAKSECGDTAILEIKDIIEFESEDGKKKFDAEIARKHRVARWMGLGVGEEPTFWDMADRRPSKDRAFEDGKIGGMKGDQCSPPHDPSVPQYQKWITGWHEGQAIKASAYQKLETKAAANPAPIEGKVEHPDTSDRPFAAPENVIGEATI